MNLKTWANEERGRAAEMARVVSVSQPIMARWIAGEEIPLERCQQIEQATNGQVTCEEMRPDKVDYFAYMRTRIAPGTDVVVSAGSALGYNAFENTATTKAD